MFDYQSIERPSEIVKEEKSSFSWKKTILFIILGIFLGLTLFFTLSNSSKPISDIKAYSTDDTNESPSMALKPLPYKNIQDATGVKLRHHAFKLLQDSANYTIKTFDEELWMVSVVNGESVRLEDTSASSSGYWMFVQSGDTSNVGYLYNLALESWLYAEGCPSTIITAANSKTEFAFSYYGAFSLYSNFRIEEVSTSCCVGPDSTWSFGFSYSQYCSQTNYYGLWSFTEVSFFFFFYYSYFFF